MQFIISGSFCRTGQTKGDFGVFHDNNKFQAFLEPFEIASAGPLR